jgi:hypothetical protein
MSRATIAMAAAVMLFAAIPAFAVPQVLQYQGRLTDAAGEPLTDPVTVTFSIYDESEGGEALWTQVFEELTLDNGRFSVLLGGEDAPFTPELIEQIREGADLFLGIQVDEDPEMAPRHQIASVVYGMHATYADTAEVALEAEAEHAASADTAEYAEEAGSAATAEFAEESAHAAEADTAEFANEAEHAATADEVTGSAGLAWQAAHRADIGTGESVSVVSVEITTPVDGYVLVSASGTLVLDNRDKHGVLVHANIGETENGVPESEMGLSIASVDASAADTKHYVPFHSQRVYAKAAGSYTFHLNVSVRSSSGTAAANRPSITALFFPTSYGAGGDGEAHSSNQRR